MNTLKTLKTRFPQAFSALTLALAIGTVGGIAVYETRANASESCCHPGAPCCHPGAACCAGHEHAAK